MRFSRILQGARQPATTIASALAPGLLDRLPGTPLWVVGDHGLASHAFREHVWDMGARPAIPPKRSEERVACPAWICRNRPRGRLTRGRLGSTRKFTALTDVTTRDKVSNALGTVAR